MDTSETYIKMCQKAEEIQSLRNCDDNIEPGDWFYFEGKIVPIVYGGYFYGSKKWIVNYQSGWECEDHITFLSHKYVWLPRLDQLPEILCNDDEGSFLWFDYWNTMRKCVEFGRLESCRFNSPEQLWLAFVMKNKFNKIWNGNDWIGAG